MASKHNPESAAGRLATGEDGEHVTFCRICEPFCGLKAQVKDGRISKLGPDRENPHSQGHVCVKGTSFLDIVYDPDRVLKPLRRIGGPGEFEEVSWETAIEDIANRLAKILHDDGPDGVAGYLGNPLYFGISGALSFSQLLDHFGIWKTYGAATQDASPRFVGNYVLYGSAFRLPIPDLPRCDFLMMVGANMLVSHGSGITAPRLREDLDAIAARGRVVVIDPRRTETAARYEHVPILPDTDAWVLGAMLNVLFERDLVNHGVLEDRTAGWQQLSMAVRGLTPELAQVHSGVSAEKIVELAEAFANTPRAVVYGRVGTCRGQHSSLINVFICALNVVCGKFAHEGGWLFGDSPLAMSPPPAFEMRETRFGPKVRIGNCLPMSFLVEDVLTKGPGQTKALLMASGNIVLSAPGGGRLEEALEALSLFVSLDLYVTETNRFADYILPGTTFLEREDVPFTGFAHMVRPFAQYTDAVISPLGETRDDHVVCNQLGSALHDRLAAEPGISGYAHAIAPSYDPLAAIDSMLAMGGVSVTNEAGVAEPLSSELLKRYPHGLTIADNVDCKNSWAKIMHEDGKLHVWHDLLEAEMIRLKATPPPPAGELRLFGRRDLKSINSWMHNSERLVRSQSPSLQMHPADAQARGLANGNWITVRSDHGEIEASLTITEDVIPGSVCYPHGWGHNGGWKHANAVSSANVNILAPLAEGEVLSAASFLDGIPVTVTLRAATETAPR
jgi:anaerobic selenocysteine-containing dehydrogenase